jgi:hypothetical protein
MEATTFDHLFAYWIQEELKTPNLIEVAKSKGYNNISQWRLDTAIRLGLPEKRWQIIEVLDYMQIVPNIIIGPFQGWNALIPKDQQLTISFAEALNNNEEFYTWVLSNQRIIDIQENYPPAATFIVFKLKESGRYIHIEGGHRICAIALSAKQGREVRTKVNLAMAEIDSIEVPKLHHFLLDGTFKQNK